MTIEISHETAVQASLYTHPFRIIRLDAIPVVARGPGRAWAFARASNSEHATYDRCNSIRFYGGADGLAQSVKGNDAELSEPGSWYFAKCLKVRLRFPGPQSRRQGSCRCYCGSADRPVPHPPDQRLPPAVYAVCQYVPPPGPQESAHCPHSKPVPSQYSPELRSCRRFAFDLGNLGLMAKALQSLELLKQKVLL